MYLLKTLANKGKGEPIGLEKKTKKQQSKPVGLSCIKYTSYFSKSIYSGAVISP